MSDSLSGERDLVSELHEIRIGLERHAGTVVVDPGLDVDHRFGSDRLEVVWDRGVVLTEQQIEARRLPSGPAD